jgi:hypothetical protein
VILDPPLGDEIRQDHKLLQRKITISEGDPAYGFGMQYPSLTASKDLPEDSDNWHIPGPSPSMQSIYDEVLYAYSRGRHPVTENPTSCTTIIRRITLSLWIGYVDRMRYVLNNNHKLLNGDEGSILWQTWLFQDLTRLKADQEYTLIFLYRNLKALEIRLGGSPKSRIVDDWEVDEWALVDARLSSLRRDIDGMASIWTHAASLTAIRTANEQSESVGRLTTLATVFLPLGLIVGVFSMGGEYAVGQSRFWMFFAITIPLGMAIAFVLFSNIAVIMFTSLRKTISLHRSRLKGSEMEDIILPLFNKDHS